MAEDCLHEITDKVVMINRMIFFMSLLLTGFSLFHKYAAYNDSKPLKKKYWILINETRCSCIYSPASHLRT